MTAADISTEADRSYVSELWQRRHFAWFLAMGNIRARNASTALGLIWWVLNPLFLGLIYFFVFGVIFDTGRDIAYLLSGMFVFYFTSQAMTGGANSILSNAKLLLNLRFPRMVLPLATVAEAIVGFGSSLLVLFAIAGVTGGLALGTNTWWIVPIFVLQTVMTIGLAALTARLAVPFRDIKNVIPYVTRLWLYVSPIIWPIEFVQRIPDLFQPVAMANPMWAIIGVYRTALLGYPLEQADLIWSAVWAILLGVGGVWSFVRYEGRMVRYL